MKPCMASFIEEVLAVAVVAVLVVVVVVVAVVVVVVVVACCYIYGTRDFCCNVFCSGCCSNLSKRRRFYQLKLNSCLTWLLCGGHGGEYLTMQEKSSLAA